jgi:cell division protein FtsN
MEGWREMTDQEVADRLRSVPRERTPEQVHEAERLRDKERGLFIQPEHHEHGESRH